MSTAFEGLDQGSSWTVK